MPKRSRSLPESLSAAEKRVLQAFYWGHLPAGSLSEALMEARRPSEPVRDAAPAQPVPALQYA